MYEYKVKKVHDVYDGDTCTLDIDLGLRTMRYKEKVRLYKINTPELRGVDEEEKQRGLEARDWLRDRLDDADEIIIKTYKDKEGMYGRLLGELFADGVNLNQEMIINGLAEPYGA